MTEDQMVLELQTGDGTFKNVLIPLRLLATDQAEVLRRLKAAGVRIAPSADDLVIQYLIDQSGRDQ